MADRIKISIIGKEDPRIFPIVEIVPKNNFFNFESRAKIGETDYFVDLIWKQRVHRGNYLGVGRTLQILEQTIEEYRS